MPPLEHPFEPVFDRHSKVLLLGSFPSVKSREYGFYYGHPQNRFWKIMAYLTKTDLMPISVESKKQMLLKNKIALWDVVRSCDIVGSSDSHMTNVLPADMSIVLQHSPIRQIFANGDKAYKLYKKYIGHDVQRLSSTSPANATYGFERLVKEWEVMMSCLG
ncbi:MAG: DNA-deoxyinosine glycosylase [Puniceicoccales bacterium]|jgi:hypoxanthine-DNA glycosylase|nr:DNA-deoxyinosine glycosylase [Puniceicoccales bacterium]